MMKCMKNSILNIFLLISLLIFKLDMLIISKDLLYGKNHHKLHRNRQTGIAKQALLSEILQYQNAKNNNKNKT